jgi:hypothetical protein
MLEAVPNVNPPTLEPDKILQTIDRLGARITERFPVSGLSNVCADLLELARETEATSRSITKPILGLRVALTAFLLVIGIALIVTISRLQIQIGNLGLADLISVIEASTSELVLIVAGLFSLVTIETRVKRSRVIAAINQLRCIAHIIDMHQLTKDPDSGQNTLDDYRLGRYLDYCSEMLALVSKIGFLYVNHLDDTEANHAVNELENLTNGLSRKIWQKITIISARHTRLEDVSRTPEIPKT